MSRAELKDRFAAEDLEGLVQLARARLRPVLRFLVGRLYSHEPDLKHRAVRALGRLVADRQLVDDYEAVELLRSRMSKVKTNAEFLMTMNLA